MPAKCPHPRPPPGLVTHKVTDVIWWFQISTAHVLDATSPDIVCDTLFALSRTFPSNFPHGLCQNGWFVSEIVLSDEQTGQFYTLLLSTLTCHNAQTSWRGPGNVTNPPRCSVFATSSSRCSDWIPPYVYTTNLPSICLPPPPPLLPCVSLPQHSW